MIFSQWMLNILRRQLFINACTLLMVVVVVLQVSAPYSGTASTLLLKILTLILVDSRLSSICCSIVGMRPLLCQSSPLRPHLNLLVHR
ncbi:unnamed protein product [Schistosoma curassoni]|uniref:Secreted protein n=1 Tax=Schistosoma curassoni TaxID=6186 RepID=A0A183JIQ3_9TREM|nr:unnamed protein product [Schistosoma curassoni]